MSAACVPLSRVLAQARAKEPKKFASLREFQSKKSFALSGRILVTNLIGAINNLAWIWDAVRCAHSAHVCMFALLVPRARYQPAAAAAAQPVYLTVVVHICLWRQPQLVGSGSWIQVSAKWQHRKPAVDLLFSFAHSFVRDFVMHQRINW